MGPNPRTARQGGAAVYNFAAGSPPPPGWVYTRAGQAWDSRGVAYAANVPVIEPGVGLWMEGARTNVALRNTRLDTAPWAKQIQNTGVTPIVTEAFAVENSISLNRCQFSRGVSGALERSRIRQDLITTANTYTLSAHAKLNSGSSGLLSFNFPGAPIVNFSLNPTLTRIAMASTVPVNPDGIKIGLYETYPDLSLDALLGLVQLEVGAFASNPIPTAATTVTRNAPTLTKTHATAQATGRRRIIGKTARGASSAGSQKLWEIRSASGQSRIYLIRYFDTTAIYLQIYSGGVLVHNATTISLANDVAIDAVFEWNGAMVTATVNGVVNQYNGAAPVSLTEESLGYQSADHWFGPIGSFQAWEDSGATAAAPPPVAIVGTPMSFPNNTNPHTGHNSSVYNHPGGTNTGIAVIVSGRMSTIGVQAVSITWDGVAVPIIVNSSGADADTSDAFVAIGVLPAAAAGVKVLNVGFSNQSRSVVTILSLENMKQAGPTGAVNSAAEYVTSGAVIAAALTATAANSLVLAGAAITYGTTCAWAAPFNEIFDAKSDAGISGSTLTQSGATASPASGATVTGTATFAAADDGRAIALVELLAA